MYALLSRSSGAVLPRLDTISNSSCSLRCLMDTSSSKSHGPFYYCCFDCAMLTSPVLYHPPRSFNCHRHVRRSHPRSLCWDGRHHQKAITYFLVCLPFYSSCLFNMRQYIAFSCCFIWRIQTPEPRKALTRQASEVSQGARRSRAQGVCLHLSSLSFSVLPFLSLQA